jgi:hypothetical protein
MSMKNKDCAPRFRPPAAAVREIAVPASRGSPGCRYPGAPDIQGTWRFGEVRELQAAADWKGRRS